MTAPDRAKYYPPAEERIMDIAIQTVNAERGFLVLTDEDNEQSLAVARR